VDVSPDTLLMTPGAVAKAITPRTKAIMPVHLYGQPVDMDPLMAIAAARGLRVVEDACQAHGARYKGRRVGSLGHAAAFSFYPGRNLGAHGDGGIVVTKDEALAARIREVRNAGQREKAGHVSPASNRRLDSIQAAVLEVKLRHLDHWNARRVEIAGHYRAGLAEMALEIPVTAQHVDSAYHLFVIQVEHRDQVLSLLRREGIGAGIHYPIPIHRQPAYAHLGHAPGSMPVSEAVAEQLISLPLFPEMTAEQVRYVTATLRSILA
jgi:dTDP-4-amino-4,6-dideoxygalactose transaminase